MDKENFPNLEVRDNGDREITNHLRMLRGNFVFDKFKKWKKE
jgi:hypothetical protein